jgi:hypothetical protein
MGNDVLYQMWQRYNESNNLELLKNIVKDNQWVLDTLSADESLLHFAIFTFWD